jgi:hypothetical protein
MSETHIKRRAVSGLKLHTFIASALQPFSPSTFNLQPSNFK